MCAIRETREEVWVQVSHDAILANITLHAHYVDGEKIIFLYLVDTWEGMPDNLEPSIHTDFVWKTFDELPYPMIPHIQCGIEWILAGETTREYYAI